MTINFSGFIQIAGIIDKHEADLLIKCGVDFLGFPLRLPVHKEDISETDAAKIIKSLSPPKFGVLITYLSESDEIIEFCNKIGAKIVQLHGDINNAELLKLKKTAPELVLIKSLVIKQDNIDQLEKNIIEMHECIDAFITDTYDPETGASGATGKTHDWSLSRRLVEVSPKPVILAGGLNADNVYDAILNVRPAGIDSHTGVENSDGRKDSDLVKRFVVEAKRAFLEIGIK